MLGARTLIGAGRAPQAAAVAEDPVQGGLADVCLLAIPGIG